MMPVVTLKDAAGVPIQFMEVGGYLYPHIPGADQDTSIPAVRNISGRDDDVLLVCNLRSGTHWLWEVLCMLHKGKAETIPCLKQSSMLEGLNTDVVDSMPSPRILNTHLLVDQLPEDMIRRKVKIVLIHRNPKDVAVSMFQFHSGLIKMYDYNGKWKDHLPLFLDGKTDCNDWFNYVKSWEQFVDENPDYPIHLMFYEDMKEDSAREIEKLSKFLELSVTKDLCEAIAVKCRFEQMKKDKAPGPDHWLTKSWRDHKQGFYRQGKVGFWKNLFTVAQNEEFDKVYEEKMKNSKLKCRFRFEI